MTLPPASSSKCRWTNFASSFFRSLKNAMSALRPAGVVDLPRSAERREFLRHAPDRRDADAAGEQHDMLGVFDQREIVARRADLDLVADFHLLDDIARAAAAVLVALDADGVAVADWRRARSARTGAIDRSADAGRYGRRACRPAACRRRRARTCTAWCHGRRPRSCSAERRSGRGRPSVRRRWLVRWRCPFAA